jgi:hypothetical protein
VSITDGGAKNNTISRSTSTSKTDSTTQSIGIDSNLSAVDPSIKVSATFSNDHSETVSIDNATSDTSESNWSKTIGINSGEAAYFAAGIRYHNLGTAPIYKTKPTNTFSLINNQSIVTVTAKENQLANIVKPGGYYPDKSQSPLLLNAKDDFGTSPITLNLDQLNRLERELQLKVDTNQVSGEIGKILANGEVMTEGDWYKYLPQIENTSARIIINDYMDKKPIERRIAAIDPQDPLEQTKPEITLKEALKLAFPDITERDGKLYYKEYNLRDKFDVVLDTKTANNISEQFDKMSDKNIYNVKLNAKMNIMINAKDSWVDSWIKSELVPSVKTESVDVNSNTLKYEVTPNSKAPSGVTYILKEKDTSLNIEKERTVSIGTAMPFQLNLSNKNNYSLVAKLPNGHEYVVFEDFSNTFVKLDIEKLFTQYHRGKGLSQEVTQVNIDEIKTKIDNVKDSDLKRELQEKFKEVNKLFQIKELVKTRDGWNHGWNQSYSPSYPEPYMALLVGVGTEGNEGVSYKVSDLSKPEGESWTILDKIADHGGTRYGYTPYMHSFEVMAEFPSGAKYIVYKHTE